MIHSGVIDNWMRVEMMHAIAKDYYEKTRDSEFRNYMMNPSDHLFFDLEKYGLMEKESCIVGMVMAWSVITLESLINHAIAETTTDESDAIKAIEFPNNIKLTNGARSALAKKLLILSKGHTPRTNLIELADQISDIRNEIVHDKPFAYFDRGDGDIEIRYYRNRGNSDGKQYRYEDLKEFNIHCQEICDFIDSYYVHYSPMGYRVSFNEL